MPVLVLLGLDHQDGHQLLDYGHIPRPKLLDIQPKHAICGRSNLPEGHRRLFIRGQDVKFPVSGVGQDAGGLQSKGIRASSIASVSSSANALFQIQSAFRCPPLAKLPRCKNEIRESRTNI